MGTLSRALPLRWLYPLIGACAAAAGTALLYGLHARPPIIAIVATALCVAVGWVLGHRWDTLRETAITDPVTGVANRRHFDARLARLVSQAARNDMALTLLFIDVDHLKAINDRLGHAGGDTALRLVGESLARTCRSRDLVARWGGDEFAILAQWTTCREGMILAHRIRETLAHLSRHSAIAPGPTVSIGIAELAHVGAPRPEALLCAADDALYRSKADGRDRVTVAPRTTRKRRRGPAMANLRTRPLRLPEEPVPTRH